MFVYIDEHKMFNLDDIVVMLNVNKGKYNTLIINKLEEKYLTQRSIATLGERIQQYHGLLK
ncbi:MAG: hypothetical protein DRP78_01315 [Candidatus Omnitrophota bacterium]|nr:MAG: hypothetical protein DRP78_01315 [Candidatus Omnitrophota bacterium]